MKSAEKLYVIEVDIEGFFDNVNHSKLMRQLWAMGIRDKKLLAIIKAILKGPIRMPDGITVFPKTGTPQGGILSPLLANVVLNELDVWIESQWLNNPVVDKYSQPKNAKGTPNKGNGYTAMRSTHLKEMYAVRYADDVRIFCRTRNEAIKTVEAIKLWLQDRLKLNVSEEKTRVINLKRQSAEFLGFKFKLTQKDGKEVAKSHVSDKALRRIKANMQEQVRTIKHPANAGQQMEGICKYNAMVRGVHNYYQTATEVSNDFARISWDIDRTIQNQLKGVISKRGSIGTKSQDYKRYGKSKQVRYIGEAWLLPLSYVQHKNPMCKKRKVNLYTPEGRAEVHDNLAIKNKWIMSFMALNPVAGQSVQYNDNRISLFAAQFGKCAVTGKEFLTPTEVHTHHKIPRKSGISDKYDNLTLVLKEVHILIHATNIGTISFYTELLKLSSNQKEKLNNLRIMVGCEPI